MHDDDHVNASPPSHFAGALLALVCGCGSVVDVLNPVPLGDASLEGGTGAEAAAALDGGIADGAPREAALADAFEAGMAQDGPDTESTDACVPRTCADYPQGTCGAQSDRCGGLTAVCLMVDGGLCPPGQSCGFGGPDLCGTLDSGPSDACVPRTCADYPQGTCGAQSDGCGGLTAVCLVVDGGACPPGQFCGGGGPNLCGAPNPVSCPAFGCVPATCATERAECGFAPDGCGGLLDCGACPGAETCTQNVCSRPDAGPPCIPATCQSLGYGCGNAFDGCGSWLDCGSCGIGQFCGGGGYLQCGGNCSVSDAGDGCWLTCMSDAGGCTGPSCLANRFACGVVPNGCGGLVECSPCEGGIAEGGD